MNNSSRVKLANEEIARYSNGNPIEFNHSTPECWEADSNNLPKDNYIEYREYPKSKK